MTVLRQSTEVKVRVGPFVDATDGVTPETGITLGAADQAELLKANGAATTDISGATWAAVTGADGWYDLTMTTSLTDTIGDATVVVQDSSVCLPVFVPLQIIEEAAYDAIYAASASPATTTSAVGSVAGAVGSVTGAVGSVTGSVGSVTGAVGSVTGNVGGNVTGSVGSLVGHTVQTGDSYARLGAPAGASVSADVAAVKVDTAATLVDTAEIGTAGAGLTDLGGMSTAMIAEVNTEADTALTDYDAPTKAEMDTAFTEIKGATWATTDTLEAIRDRGDAAWTTGAGGSPPQLLQSTTIATLSTQTSFTLTAGSADDDAYNNAIVVVTDQSTATQKAVGSVSDYTGSTKTVTLSADPAVFTMATGDTIEIIAALGSAGSAPSAASIADAVWDEATSGHTTSGTFGEQVKTDIDAILVDTAEIGAAGAGLTEAGGTGDQFTAVPWNASWDAEVQSECTDALNAYDPPTKTELDSGFSALNDPTAAAVADAVWDESTSGHTTSGTFGEQVKTDVDAIKVVTDALPDSGALSSLATASALTTVDNEVGAIQADLDNATDGLGALKALIDTVNTDLSNGTDGLGALKTLVDAVQTAVDALNDLSAAQVNAEVVDALATDTYAEPGSIPAATASLSDKLSFITAIARNKLTQTSTTQTLRNDADSGNIGTRTVSDDCTTYTQAEWS